jgi:hypothetical protein
VLAVTSAVCATSVALAAGVSIWQGKQRQQDIQCVRAAIAAILDARAAQDFARNPEVGRATLTLFNDLKTDLLEPRDCPAIDNLYKEAP